MPIIPRDLKVTIMEQHNKGRSASEIAEILGAQAAFVRGVIKRATSQRSPHPLWKQGDEKRVERV